MGSFFVVRDGDHASKIAKKFGFRSFRSVWDDPGNAALRQVRPNPNVLLPGDSVFIPDRQERDEAADTGKRHTFFTIAPSLKLRIVVKDRFDVPLGGEVGALDVDGDARPVTTGRDGLVERVISIDADRAELDVGRFHRRVKIGHLEPVDGEKGWLARLDNLGYEPGPLGRASADELRSAVEEFQCDAGLPVTGVMDAVTQQRLLLTHGS